MKLIIDIDEETYKMCKRLLGDADGIERAIANGIPLPKGHGRLIDADELLLKSEWYGESFTFDNPMPNGNEAVSVEDIENAPTVEPCYQTTSCLDCKMYDKENRHCPRFCEVIRELIKEANND